ncbi:MAG: PAS domain S-box protein [Oscillatoriophycideae cyanobacterium NC_groundwater_1537_Pr4_S-0.65um_50_18]|nr:PAS domain S-box protein [Oscillatoriophycideae cyanobacterium NC_groundwater_1537_Pr4_S-0.65um_50_18]
MMGDLFSAIGGTSDAVLDFIATQLLDPIAVYSEAGEVVYTSPAFLNALQLLEGSDFFADFADKTPVNLVELWQRAMAGDLAAFYLQAKNLHCSLHFSQKLQLMFVRVKPLSAKEIGDRQDLPYAGIEAKWAAFARHSLNLFLEADETGKITYSTPAIEQVLGYTIEQALSFHLLDLIHPQDVNAFDLIYRLWMNGIEPAKNGIECRWKTAANDWVYVYVQRLRVNVESGKRHLILTAYNITDRKLLEADLQASEQKFRSLVLNMPGAAFRCDGSYTMGYISDGIQQVTGYPASDFINDRVRSFLSIVLPADIDLIEASIEAAMQDNHANTLEYRIIHADGSIRWMSEHRQGVFHNGNLLWFDGILLDISDRKRAEAQLRQSIAINHAVISAVPGLVMRLSSDGQILSIYSDESMDAIAPFQDILQDKIGHHLAELLPYPLGEQCMTYIERALKMGEIQVEFRVPKSDRMGEARITVIGKNEVLAIVREITAHRRVRR